MSDNNPLTNDDLPYDVDIDYVDLQQNGIDNTRKIDIASGRGSHSAIMSNTLIGFNHRMAPAAFAKNREIKGLPFFTRPDMNLNAKNLSVSRRFQDLADSPPGSAAYSILTALDPLNELAALDKSMLLLGAPIKYEIPFDNRSAFIPLLSNALLNFSGMPENTVDSYVSEAGIRREQIIMVDSTYEINNAFTANATFRNMDGDPVTRLFSTWLEYMSGVFIGDMLPRARAIFENEIDYQTRAYFLNMDATNRYVTRISAINAMYPVNDNIAAMMNVDMLQPFITDGDQINIQFQCAMCEHGDPILIQEFNDVVGIFNTDMLTHPDSTDEWTPYGKDSMRKLRLDEILNFNYYGYPRIDPYSKELQWWVYSDDYELIMNEVKDV